MSQRYAYSKLIFDCGQPTIYLLSQAYFRGLLGVLKHGGFAYIQVPIKDERVNSAPFHPPTKRLKHLIPVSILAILRKLRRPNNPVVELDMYPYSLVWIKEAISNNNCTLVDQHFDEASGVDLQSCRFVIKKN